MRKMLVAVAVVGLLAACGPATKNVGETPAATDEITITEGELDLAPATRVNVVMQPEGDPEARCRDLGGRYLLADERHYCLDVAH